jgi:hypothetical protein
MIIYHPDPAQEFITTAAPSKIKYYRLSNGGILSGEDMGDGRIRLLGLCSTDPADYLNSRYEPGRIFDTV